MNHPLLSLAALSLLGGCSCTKRIHTLTQQGLATQQTEQLTSLRSAHSLWEEGQIFELSDSLPWSSTPPLPCLPSTVQDKPHTRLLYWRHRSLEEQGDKRQQQQAQAQQHQQRADEQHTQRPRSLLLPILLLSLLALALYYLYRKGRRVAL